MFFLLFIWYSINFHLLCVIYYLLFIILCLLFIICKFKDPTKKILGQKNFWAELRAFKVEWVANFWMLKSWTFYFYLKILQQLKDSIPSFLTQHQEQPVSVHNALIKVKTSDDRNVPDYTSELITQINTTYRQINPSRSKMINPL